LIFRSLNDFVAIVLVPPPDTCHKAEEQGLIKNKSNENPGKKSDRIYMNPLAIAHLV
jgi:hypothetical protein